MSISRAKGLIKLNTIFFENMSRNIKSRYNLTRTTGDIRED